MPLSLLSVYRPWQIEGNMFRVFDRVAIRASQARANSLFLVRDESPPASITQALRQGCRLFAGLGPMPSTLARLQGVTWVQVTDTTQALFDLAARFRDASPAVRIAVTGSNGKTTTKDMITLLLRSHYRRVVKTYGNDNGTLGVPYTITRLDPRDRFVVIEIGMAHRVGSMQPRASLVRPHAAVVTTVGVSHMGFLGSREAIAQEKSQVIKSLMPGGLAVLNGDNMFCREMAAFTEGPVIYFGVNSGNDVRATGIVQSMRGLRFRLHYRKESVLCYLPVLGVHHVYNALAATAVARWAGVPLEQIARVLRRFTPFGQHGRLHKVGNVLILDDGYNSDPYSVQSVLDTLQAWPGKRKWMVLGDMQMLEGYTARYYSELAHKLQSAKLSGVVFLGEEIRRTFEALPARSYYYWARNERDAVQKLLTRQPKPNLIWLKSNNDRLFRRLRNMLIRALRRRRR